MRKIFVFIFLFCFYKLSSQENLLSLIDEPLQENLVFATFKTKKIINLQSIEQTDKNELDFIISHRFGPINSGYTDLYGIDIGLVRMILDYGITDYISLILARGSTEKVIDISSKIKLLSQGKNKSPITISSYSSIFFDTIEGNVWGVLDEKTKNKGTGFFQQILIASKLNTNLSAQLTPIFSNMYLVDKTTFLGERKNLWAIGIGGRYKLNKSVTLNSEWISPIIDGKEMIHPIKNKYFINSFAIGFDIETGGHVFQFFCTNSDRMSEKGYVFQNNNQWTEGGVFFGFNISRTFNLQ